MSLSGGSVDTSSMCVQQSPHTAFPTDSIKRSDDLVKLVFQVLVMAVPLSADGDFVLPWKLLTFQLVVHFLAFYPVDAT